MSKYDSIIGLKELMSKCVNISDKVANEYLLEALKSGTLVVRDAAVMLVPVNHGELRHSIRRSHERLEDGARGVVYTNKEYASYVEFGTGPKGEENHAGISPNFTPTYTQTPWWIHESQIDAQTAEKYHWFYIETPDGRFYQVTGQPAQPFLYPALHDTKDEVVNKVGRYLAKKIKEEASK